jgi:hypothetical protein
VGGFFVQPLDGGPMLRRITAIAAAALLVACFGGRDRIAAAGQVIVSDAFNRADGTTLGSTPQGQAWTLDGRSTWGVQSGRARVLTGPSNGPAMTWIRAGATDHVTIAADITLSPTYRRANAGLVYRLADRRNNFWSKLEVSPGHPNGLMTIGKTSDGAVTSLLAKRDDIGLRNGATYHLSVDVDGTSIAATVSGDALPAPVTIRYSLTSAESARYSANDGYGLRVKLASDEDDGGSRWDAFSVTAR